MPDNSLDNIELRSEEVQEILTKVPHWMIRWGNVLFLFLIILLLVISWFVKYPDIIPSEAQITTQIPPQKEYARTTSKIDAILVEDNQNVIPNQALAVLENSANYEDVFKLKSIIDTIHINKASFNFPIDELPVLFLGDIDAQFAIFENSYNQYIINRNYKPYNNQLQANQFSVSQLKRQLISLKSQRNDNKAELAIAETELKRQENLYNKGVISAQAFDNAKLAYSQSERTYKNFENTISQLREAINNAEMTSVGTQINSTKEELTLLKGTLQSFTQLKKAIRDWERQYVLKSNINGKVAFLNIWNVNQTVNQGDLVFTIIPTENSSFIAKLKTPAQNSGKIKIGQKVNVKLENYPDTEFGVLNGEVKNIPVIPDNEGFYVIDVSLPKKLITTYGKEIEFKQEMRGAAEIITEDLRLLQRFFYQFKQVLKR